MKNYIYLTTIFFLFSALIHSKTLYEETIYNIPSLKEEATVYLGDRMLTQATGEWKECITPKKTYVRDMGPFIGKMTYKANEPICKANIKSKNFFPTYDNVLHGASGSTIARNVSWRGKTEGKKSLCIVEMLSHYGCIKNLSSNDVTYGDTFVYTPNTFQQSIEYSGRSGDILKFNYAEFSEGFARQAFSREFQIDLNEGKVAAFKGAIIEIIDATNVEIKYKVIRNFASDL